MCPNNMNSLRYKRAEHFEISVFEIIRVNCNLKYFQVWALNHVFYNTVSGPLYTKCKEKKDRTYVLAYIYSNNKHTILDLYMSFSVQIVEQNTDKPLIYRFIAPV